MAASDGGVRWITCDHPGSGRSSKRALACTTGGLALSATRVLDELGLETAHIAGASLGGAVALQVALRVPHRVRSLILMGTTAGGPLDRRIDPRKLMAVTARVVWGSLRRRRLWLAPAIFSPDFLAHEPDRAKTLTAAAERSSAGPVGARRSVGGRRAARRRERPRPHQRAHADPSRRTRRARTRGERRAAGAGGRRFRVAHLPWCGTRFRARASCDYGLDHPRLVQRHPVAGTPPP